MKIHFYRQTSAIKYTGEEDRKARELLKNPIPTLANGDVLIVPEQSAKFMTRDGSPFERVDFEEELKDSGFADVIADDAVKAIELLTIEKEELEGEVVALKAKLEAIETRETSEVSELKAVNEELNKKLEDMSEVKEKTVKPKTTRTRKTTTASKGEN